jgi:hypothetical protein
MSIVLQSSGGGSVTLQEAVTASNLTITVPAVTGTMNLVGPAFSAYPSVATTIANSVWTKLTCNIEEFDTNSAYNNATYIFQPTVAGYYQVNGAFSCSATTLMVVAVYKNGTEFKRGVQTGGTSTLAQIVVSTLVYLNGSTDYIELYGIQSSGTSQTLSNAENQCYFQATMTRGA